MYVWHRNDTLVDPSVCLYWCVVGTPCWSIPDLSLYWWGCEHVIQVYRYTTLVNLSVSVLKDGDVCDSGSGFNFCSNPNKSLLFTIAIYAYRSTSLFDTSAPKRVLGAWSLTSSSCAYFNVTRREISVYVRVLMCDKYTTLVYSSAYLHWWWWRVCMTQVCQLPCWKTPMCHHGQVCHVGRPQCVTMAMCLYWWWCVCPPYKYVTL